MLHPQARALLALMAENGVQPTHTLTPEVARAQYRERRFYTQPAPPAVAQVLELKAPGPHGEIPCGCTGPSAARTARPCPPLSTSTAADG